MRFRVLAFAGVLLVLTGGLAGCIPGLFGPGRIFRSVAILYFLELANTDPNNCSADQYTVDFDVEFTRQQDEGGQGGNEHLGTLTLRQSRLQFVTGFLLLDYTFHLVGSGTHGNTSYQEAYDGSLGRDGSLQGSYSFTQEGCGTVRFDFSGTMDPILTF